MKKKLLFNIAIFSVFLIALNILGCSINQDVSVEEKGGVKNCLYGSVENLSEEPTSSLFGDSAKSVARQISPSPDNSAYDYYVCANTQGLYSVEFPITSVTVNASNEFRVMMTPGLWDVTLFAVIAGTDVTGWSKENIAEKSVLVGRSIADLTNGSCSVPFVLNTAGLTGGGMALFTIALAEDSSGSGGWSLPNGSYTVKSEICNYATGKVVNYIDSTTPIEHWSTFTLDTSDNIYKGTFGSSTKKIPQGTYSFKVTVYDNLLNEIAVWTDSILIITGRTCSETVYIPNIIGEKPAAPATFTATYYKNSEDLSGHENMYQVHFQWENTPNTETHYEMQVADISGRASAAFNEDVWGILDSNLKRTIGREYSGREDYVDGGLGANNTDLTLWLALGHHYAARIRSCNHAGNSDWTYLTIPTSGVSYGSKEIAYFVPDGSGTAAKTIHRARITYNLNGGFYYESATNVVANKKYVYFVQNSPVESETTAILYWNGDGYEPSVATNNLHRSSEEFMYWCSNLNSLSTSRLYTKGGANEGYKGYKNLTLYADYVDSGTPVDENISNYKLLAKWVTYKVGSPIPDAGIGDPVTSDSTATFALIDVNQSDNYLAFYLTIPNDVDEKKDGVQQFPAMYDELFISVEAPDGTLVYDHNFSAPVYGATSGMNILQVTDWAVGSIYTITITAARTTGDGTSKSVKVYVRVQ